MPESDGSPSSQTKAWTAREMKPEPRRAGYCGIVRKLLFLQVQPVRALDTMPDLDSVARERYSFKCNEAVHFC